MLKFCLGLLIGGVVSFAYFCLCVIAKEADEHIEKKQEPPRRDVCWMWGGQLCCDCDYDTSDYGIEEPGVVANLHCMNCGAEVQYTYINGENEQQD